MPCLWLTGTRGNLTVVKWVGTRCTIQLKTTTIMCVCTGASTMVCMEKSEDNLQELEVFCVPPCESQGLNPGGQAWQQVPPPA